MYWNVIDENRKNVLRKVTDTININKYYMAGGTALALQIGIRESFDFDFFVQEEFDTDLLANTLSNLGNFKINYISKGTLHCILDNVQLTFLYFPNTLIDELIRVDGFKNLHLASIKDIATMKLIAISQRGTKKDFFDLYNICINQKLELRDIFVLLKIKYNEEKLNYFHITKSLVYFDDAEDEILSKIFIDYDWKSIKDFYIKQYKNLL